MTRLRLRPALLSLGLLLHACGGGGGSSDEVRAGDAAPGQLLAIGPGPHPRVDMPGRISVLLQVLTENGAPVPGLTAEDFVLREDDQPVSLSESSQRLLPKPRVYRAYAHLLLDRSGSVSGNGAGLEAEREAAHAFVDAALAEPSVFLAVSWFAGDPTIVPGAVPGASMPLGYTDDAAALHAAIDSDEVLLTSSSTNLYGAFVGGLASLDEVALEAQAESLEFTSLSLVTFTDGTDQAGLVSREQALEALGQGANSYASYTIGLGAEIDTEALALLGPDGFVQAADAPDLIPGFVDVASDVRDLANSFYLIGYLSPKLAGDHDLSITATQDGGSASIQFAFSAEHFSGGGGFLDTRDPAALGLDPLGGSVDALVAEAEGGATLVLGEESLTGTARALRIVAWDAEGSSVDRYGSTDGLTLSSLAGDDHLSCQGAARTDEGLLLLCTLRSGAADMTPRVLLVRVADTGEVTLTAPYADGGTGLAAATSLAVDADGSAFVLGRVGATGFAVWRCLASPFEWDTSFAGGGTFSWAEEPEALGIEIKSSGAGVALVLAALAGSEEPRLLRLDSSGAVDTALFGVGGIASVPDTGASAPRAHALAVDEANGGRILLAGSVGSPPVPAIWRFAFDGSPDTSFAGSPQADHAGTGLVVLPSSYFDNSVGAVPNTAPLPLGATLHTLAIQADGSLLLAGVRLNEEFSPEWNEDGLWLRLRPSGTVATAGVAPGWNKVGYLIEDGSNGDDFDERVSEIVVLSDGTILSSGTSHPSGEPGGPVVWRDTDPDRILTDG